MKTISVALVALLGSVCAQETMNLTAPETPPNWNVGLKLDFDEAQTLTRLLEEEEEDPEPCSEFDSASKDYTKCIQIRKRKDMEDTTNFFLLVLGSLFGTGVTCMLIAYTTCWQNVTRCLDEYDCVKRKLVAEDPKEEELLKSNRRFKEIVKIEKLNAVRFIE